MSRIQYDRCDRCLEPLPGTALTESNNDKRPRVHLTLADTPHNGSPAVVKVKEYHFDLCEVCRASFIAFMHGGVVTPDDFGPVSGFDGVTKR